MLFHDRRAEHIGHDRGEYAVIVPGITYYRPGKLLLQYFYYAEVQVVILGGVFGYAMEKADFVVMFYDGFVRHADLFHCGGPGVGPEDAGDRGPGGQPGEDVQRHGGVAEG